MALTEQLGDVLWIVGDEVARGFLNCHPLVRLRRSNDLKSWMKEGEEPVCQFNLSKTIVLRPKSTLRSILVYRTRLIKVGSRRTKSIGSHRGSIPSRVAHTHWSLLIKHNAKLDQISGDRESRICHFRRLHICYLVYRFSWYSFGELALIATFGEVLFAMSLERSKRVFQQLIRSVTLMHPQI